MGLCKTDYLIIIRAAGERTEKLCKKLCEGQGYPENVVVVKEVPFHKSLVKGFEIAMEHNHRWTFCVDADILLKTNAIAECLEKIDKSKRNTFRVESALVHKFHQAKLGGVHCYLTSNIADARKYFSEAEENLKPETYINRKMLQDGMVFQKIDFLAGLHEYGLSFDDIYRRYRFRYCKGSIDEISLLKYHARKLKKEDDDFKVVLKAFKDSRKNPISAHSKMSVTEIEISAALSKLGLQEKDQFAEDIGFEYVQNIIDNFETPAKSQEFEQFFWNNIGLAKPKNLGSKRYKKNFGILDRIRDFFDI